MKASLTNWIKKHQLISFFALSYLITFVVQFLFIYLNPSASLPPWSLAWFLSVFGPSFSAIIITWIIGGMEEVKHLLSGFTRFKVRIGWYFAASFLFLGPLMIALVYRALGNQVGDSMPSLTILSLLGQIVFTLFSGPISEELGWRGFALPRLQLKHNALVSSLILGVIHCCWHIPLFFMVGSSQIGIPFPIYLVLVVTLTVYITWLYNNTRRSLIITVLAHFAFNATGFITGIFRLMPPMVFYMSVGPLLGLLVVGIIFIFKPRYLSKKPIAELPGQF